MKKNKNKNNRYNSYLVHKNYHQEIKRQLVTVTWKTRSLIEGVKN